MPPILWQIQIVKMYNKCVMSKKKKIQQLLTFESFHLLNHLRLNDLNLIYR